MPSNWCVEHKACSDKSGQSVVIAKAKADALRDAGFSAATPLTESRPLPFSLSASKDAPSPTKEVPERLRWDPDIGGRYPWLRTTVPDDAAPPLAMTPPPDNAVGSYGAEAIQWIEATQTDNSGRPLTLRWWQKLAIVRQLEHDADGRLVWRTVVESGPRRIGKSIRLRGVALWRMANAELFGEVQTVMHTGQDMAICREIQRHAWRWASGVEWKVTKGNGKEAIETPDSDRWLVRAQDAVYGYDVTLGMVDEAWAVKPDTVSEGLEPALMEREEPQLHLTSTAHRRATSLMRNRIRDALAADDGETLLLLWGAPEGADISDPEVWRAASPHWSEDRRQMITKKYAKALAGEEDPDADDPDPIEGFKAQYLNMWKLKGAATRGQEAVKPEVWELLQASRPTSPPDAAAVESWFGAGCSVAFAWRVGDRVVVSSEDYADLGDAVAAVKATGYRKLVTVGASLMEDPAVRGLRTRKGVSRSGSSIAELQRLIAEDAFRHDGGAHLSGQVLSARTTPGADGPRLASKERADAIKAAVWAVSALRRKAAGPVRLIVARGR
ncbi:HNH endonuclease [Kribbella italica]|uniref:Terminase n=1 Tax=Kribbella italica TaxID=1540520 RepID=A0A7W9J8W1_9ACTN|nr:HNH endonuclease [Kribbella italica]MBB5837757.1 hypothetical protein [Kribbella italica]